MAQLIPRWLSAAVIVFFFQITTIGVIYPLLRCFLEDFRAVRVLVQFELNMAGKRVTQSAVNWAMIAERVPEAERASYLAFKAKSDGFLRKYVKVI